jgi:short-subunit dehydrogenase
MRLFSSQEPVVAITGASAGVGRATALRFARAGYRVGLIARDPGALDEVRAEIELLGAKACCAPADVAQADAVFRAADAIEEALGPIEVWVNDAMVTMFAPVAEMTPEEFRRITEVTYLGFVHGTMAALRHMRPRNRGTIVQVGSALAYRGIPLQSAYCGAKHAIRGFTNSLRTELIHDNSRVRLTIVELPAINTPQFDWARTRLTHKPRPVPPVFEPERAAEAVFHAAHGRWREYWLGMSTLQAIIGNMLAPGLLDRYLARNGYDAQSTPEPLPPGRKDNLVQPVAGLHRMRGAFGAEAHNDAVDVPAPVVRTVAVVLGCAISVAAGLLAGKTHSALALRKTRRRRDTLERARTARLQSGSAGRADLRTSSSRSRKAV